MSRIATALILALAPLIAACGTASEAAPAPAPVKQSTASGDFQTGCMTVMQRNRTCTDDYIPALVDRFAPDLPPSIPREVLYAKLKGRAFVGNTPVFPKGKGSGLTRKQINATGFRVDAKNVAANAGKLGLSARQAKATTRQLKAGAKSTG